MNIKNWEDIMELELEMKPIQMIVENKNSKKLKFRPIDLSSKDKIESYTKPWNLGCSDLSFANLFIWGANGKIEYAERNNVLYIKLDFEKVPTYLWAPIPKYGVEVDYREAVYTAIDYMKSIGTEPTLRSVWQPFKEKIEQCCPELYIEPTEMAWDYVYERESLATLKGKKLHGKRNHINKFMSKYPDYRYAVLEDSMIKDCIALYEDWSEQKEELPTEQLDDEKTSVMLALYHRKALGLNGGCLFVKGKLVAFTVGERISDNMQLIHIEKAKSDIEGAYPMINQQYILNECQNVEYVNREEDMGIEGMRKAKRSYQPVKMIEKYIVSIRDLSEEKGIWG